MAVVAPTDLPKSVRNHGEIEDFFVAFFVLSRCFQDFSVGVGAFSHILSCSI